MTAFKEAMYVSPECPFAGPFRVPPANVPNVSVAAV